MSGSQAQGDPLAIWTILGTIGALTFYARFYIQWIYSEIRGRSVIPVAFWYMSGAGSLMLLIYSASIPSPVGALSHSFNSVVYARNLVHVWRRRGTLSRTRNVLLHSAAAIIVAFGVGMLAVTWQREIETAARPEGGLHARVLLWIVVGGIGQALFAMRFVLQWLATERAGRSIIPPAFWYISVAASAMLMLSHASRQEWIFVAGLASTLLVYLRNILLIRLHRGDPGAVME